MLTADNCKVEDMATLHCQSEKYIVWIRWGTVGTVKIEEQEKVER